MAIGANAKKRGMAETDLSRVARKNHQADTGDRVHEQQSEFAEIVRLQKKRGREQERNDKTNADLFAGFCQEANIVCVARFE